MFKILTTCYNCEAFIKECIESVLAQNESEWEMYIIEDASTDNTVKEARKASYGDPRIKILSNKNNNGLTFNQTLNFVHHAKPNDEDVIIILDGDDYFLHPNVLSYVKEIYSRGYWFTYGGIRHSARFRCPEDFYTEINWSVSLRNQTFCITHLRSYKFFLLKNIKNVDLRNKNNNFFEYGVDVALCIPMVEMAGENKCFHVEDGLYYYRFHENNVHSSVVKDAQRSEYIQRDLSFRTPYAKKTKEQLLDSKCDWSII